MNEPGAVVTEIARSAGVVTSLLYRWRRQFAAEREMAAFVPVRVSPDPSEAVATTEPACAPPSAPPSSITIAFRDQVRMTIEGAPDASTLANVIGALTARDRWR
jgi:transposase